MTDRYPYRHHGPAVHGSKLADYLISEANMIEDIEQLRAETAMTDLTDKLADVIGKNISQSPRGIAHAIIAALPGMVKPLEWREWPTGERESAVGPNSTLYEVSWTGYRYIDDWSKWSEWKECDSRDSAKAAANAHSAATIMAALGVEGE